MSNYNKSGIKQAVAAARRYNKLMVRFLRSSHPSAAHSAKQSKKFVRTFIAEARAYQQIEKARNI